MNALIVEDEVRLADALMQILKDRHYQADAVYNGKDGFDYLCSGFYDVAIIDVMLPKMNGYELVKQARKEGVETPVLMLTARTALGDKVQGLDSGADDYLTKPFQSEELLARLRALTRRKGEVILNEIRVGDLTLDLSSSTLECKGRSVNLSFREFEVMKLLASNPKQAISKETLFSRVWGIDSEADENSVEAYISFLRKKLNFLKSSTQIQTRRMIGYRLMPAEEGASDADNPGSGVNDPNLDADNPDPVAILHAEKAVSEEKASHA